MSDTAIIGGLNNIKSKLEETNKLLKKILDTLANIESNTVS